MATDVMALAKAAGEELGAEFHICDEGRLSALVDGKVRVDLWELDMEDGGSWVELYVYPEEGSDALSQKPVYVKMCLDGVTASEAAMFVHGAAASYRLTQFEM